jgi:hypothetical protein
MPTVPNLRDVGGYKTSDGKTLARGIAYRASVPLVTGSYLAAPTDPVPSLDFHGALLR